MSSAINQKEYLKKYLGIGKAPGDKKKKKKKEKKLGDRLKIIDDDVDFLISQEIEDDLAAANEDAPQIVAIIDERPPSLQVDEHTKSNLWEPIGGPSSSTRDIPTSKLHSFKLNKQLKSADIEKSTFKIKKESIYISDGCNKRRNYIKGDNLVMSEEESKESKSNREKSNSPVRKDKKDRSLSPLQRSRDDESPLRRRSKEDISPPRKNKRESSSSPIRRKEYSPPRRKKKDSSSPRRKREDSSPTRKNKRDHSLTPPQKNRDNESPPRKKNKEENSSSPIRKKEYSPPRRKREDNLSPQRKTVDDISPPRRNIRSDNSPPRRKERPIDSPSKRNLDDCSSVYSKKNRDDDSSPPRRKYKGFNSSPPRKRNKSNSPPRKKNSEDDACRSRESKAPYSYTQKKSKREESPSRTKTEEKNKKRDRISRWNQDESPECAEKIKKTLDGKKAGLQNAKDVSKESVYLRQKEDEIFKNMLPEVSGKDAVTVFRAKKGKDIEEEANKRKKQKEMKEKYDRWGKGLKQVEDQNQRIEEQLHEMSKPLARYADDEDLEKFLKEQERDGDPMLDYIRKKKRKQNVSAGIPEKPTYMGEFMPNRFGIGPGYRWDGVDRSNGYEKKWFQVQNAKRAKQEEAFKWSTEDM